MKKLLLASVALIVAATAAMAADAPVRHKRYVKAPVYKAPPMPYIAPAYDWSGLYVGGHVGWGHLRDSVTTQAAGGLLALGAVNTITSDQFIGGLQGGYNFMVAPHILLGFEGEFTWLTRGYSTNIVTLAPPTILTDTSNPDWVATAAGRLGYTNDNLMIYAKGGGAWLDTKYGASQFPAAGVPFSTSVVRAGYTVGGGLEYGITQNWSAKAEYAYLDFGTNSYNVGFGGATTATGIKTDMQQFKLGLNYRFNGFGSMPVLAEPISTKY
ncbi:MAG: porin family protein [Rhizobiales bacterium]|nr:porin family protein [Hyphomicrobiales bacterium]